MENLKQIINRTLPVTVIVISMMGLSGCASMKDRIDNIGQTPALTEIQNPVEKAGYRPVSLPMPAVELEVKQANSLWKSGRQTFFKDQRAQKIGDILTVMIEIKDDAEIDNATTRTRSNQENAALPNLLGVESQLTKVLPEALSLGSLVDMDSSTSNSGTGTIEREEEINLKLAAMISEILPNGNLVIHGRQEVRVNYEVRELQLVGVIRPEDIASTNTISYDKIAEARISYGGRGHITDVQQPRYGQQFFDVVFPF